MAKKKNLDNVHDRKSYAARMTPLAMELVKKWLGHMLEDDIRVSTKEEDRKLAADIVIEAGDRHVQVRARRPTPYRDLTLRCYAPEGIDHELDKVRLGHVDYFIVIWENSDNAKSIDACDWAIIDAAHMRGKTELLEDPPIRRNTTGNHFAFFAIQDLAKEGTVIACQIAEYNLTLP